MKIDILCNDGSPLGITMKTLWGDEFQVGCGGAEYALLTMCEAWNNTGHDVVLYNNPRKPNESPFEQRPIDQFNPNNPRDILIVFRSPNIRSIPVTNCLKIWWSTDQYTIGDFSNFSKQVDKIVCISSHHSEYFAHTYGIQNAHVIDIPVRTQDYENKNIEKIRNRFIFTSVPDRGLDNLLRMWQGLKRSIPDASLVITSDYRLWGVGEARNEQHRVRWLSKEDVEFLGAVPRKRLIEEQLKAEIMLYPCNYEELFCIAVAEAQVAGVYPITSAIGALKTTNMGTVLYVDADNLHNDISFLEKLFGLVTDRNEFLSEQERVQHLATKRFNINNILAQWESKIFNG